MLYFINFGSCNSYTGLNIFQTELMAIKILNSVLIEINYKIYTKVNKHDFIQMSKFI